jgi:NAD(P)-dependent dehydrogenase (short-subunit alcohol dehydrogenase family)
MTMHLQGKSVVVTGAGRGMGAAFAAGAAALGAAVMVNDLDGDCAQKVADDIRAKGGKAIAHVANIGIAAQAEGLVNACVKEFGAIDGLVNNAGLIRFGRLEESSEADIRAMVDANIMGTYNCAFHAIRHMYRQKRGSIVNIVSGAQAGLMGMSGYGATKGAVASFTYTWAQEAKDTGVRVNAVSPMAATRMTESTNAYYAAHGAKPQAPQEIPPEINAPVVTFLLSDLSRDVNGQVVRITGSRLSLMTHPGVRLPILEQEKGWTIESIDAAFKETLSALQLPPTIAVLDVQSVKPVVS